MGKLAWIKRNARRLTQWCALLIGNGYAAGFSSGRIYTGAGKRICLPGLNCYSCPGALGACPIGSLQAVLGSHKFSFSYYVAGLLIFFGAVLGRFVCGWLCPFGLVQELIHKIPLPRALRRLRRKSLPGHRVLKWLKYAILAWFVILAPLFIVDIVGQGSPWFCKYICPAGTLEGGWTLVLLDPMLRGAIGFLYAWKSAILVVLILMSLFIYRPFCKYLCPLGAIYSVFNPVALVRYRFDAGKCTSCGQCTRACPMSIDVKRNCNSLECIRCGACLRACKPGALDYANHLPRRKPAEAQTASEPDNL
ncbi:MAG TPA: 4Fe-4S binding protein [Candidatus Fimadaptatus faecigallinarum]|uniref:4Fe-4S binding protein n=1 Tax=Candidatus Fimadaptatus faecigallinarum TaxID=2840814 RepID=A0A9D1S455_9FIRM|nr:4Fe-4S binding protein [Candidatus Fimadaptatus faecigallinarum]